MGYRLVIKHVFPRKMLSSATKTPYEFDFGQGDLYVLCKLCAVAGNVLVEYENQHIY